jgi:ABC-type branched-subunit amino acid transport system substrate-binding protein
LTLRPPDFERARRLALALRGNQAVHKVAIAIPESGFGLGFASCFEHACRALRLPVVQLDYASGVRNYAVEAARFDSSGAEAILLAGPGAESAEWLLALAKHGRRPLVLGDLELDPSGFHEHARAALEGAIVVGEDWSGWPTSARALRAAADSAGFAGSEDFARAFALGQVLGMEVAAGAFTPTSLLGALQRDSLPHIYGASDWNWLGARLPGPSAVMREVPLWIVRKGRLEPWAASR